MISARGLSSIFSRVIFQLYLDPLMIQIKGNGNSFMKIWSLGGPIGLA
jgi:hypothetical protein